MTIPPLNVSQILRQYNLSPKKSLGQNFLVSENTLQKIVTASGITKDSEVLEIGPGLGSLTRYIAEYGKCVTAVELDDRFIPVLDETLAAWDNVRIIHSDILKLDPAEVISQDRYLVIANIPYYITSALIRHLLEADKKPAIMVLTVQAEVAKRVCAEPGNLSLLGLSVQVYGKPKIMLRIPAGSFHPVPKIDSIALRVDLYPEPLIPDEELDTFFKLAKAGFSQKRKTLRNSISAGLRTNPQQTEILLKSADIDPKRRAQTLNIEEWAKLTDCYLSSKNG